VPATRKPAFVASAIAEGFGLADITLVDLPKRVRIACADHPTLLVPDNFEQLLDAAPLVADLLSPSQVVPQFPPRSTRPGIFEGGCRLGEGVDGQVCAMAAGGREHVSENGRSVNRSPGECCLSSHVMAGLDSRPVLGVRAAVSTEGIGS
jgi:hypothetical protein